MRASDDAALQAEAVRLAAGLCRRFEGLRLRPYLCPAGVPTIGYGSTLYPDGRRVTQLDRAITQAEAEAMLQADLMRRLPEVLRLCPAVDTAGRLAALLDFAYNVGIGALSSSTLRKRVNEARWADAAQELERWNKAGGKVLAGLVKRREAEAILM